MIVKIKDFITDEQVNSCLHLYSTIPSRNGKETTAEHTKKYKQSTVYYGNDKNSNSSPELTKIILQEDIVKTIEDNITASFFKVKGMHLSEYKSGDYYDWHLDYAISNLTPQIPSPRLNKIAFTIWLNNPEEYNGGELIIKTENGEEKVKPNKGCAIFYPSDYLHKVNKITKGTRKVIIGWLDCSFKNPRDRYMLVELNKSIDYLESLHQSEIINDSTENELLKKNTDTIKWIRQQIIRKTISH